MSEDSTKICPNCKKQIHKDASRCQYCKAWLAGKIKPRKHIDTLLLAQFLGVYGVHRFYTGYYLIGIIQLLTLGGCGIWSTIDFITICFNNYKDANALPLENYDKTLGVAFFILYLFGYICLFLLILSIVPLACALAVQGVR